MAAGAKSQKLILLRYIHVSRTLVILFINYMFVQIQRAVCYLNFNSLLDENYSLWNTRPR